MQRLKGVEECLYPKTLEEAAFLIKVKGDNARIVGGGLHLTAFPNPSIKTLIFLNNLNLSYVKLQDNFLHIGALTTISEFAEHNHIKNLFHGNLSEISRNIASELLRNQITFGGSVAQREPYSDIANMLLTLNAKVVLHDGEKEEEMTVEELYSKEFRVILKKKVVKEVFFENFGNNYNFYMERLLHNATDIPHLNLAMLVKMEQNKILHARIFVGARPSAPYRFTLLEDFLKGKDLDKKLAEKAMEFAKENVEVEQDIKISKDYRRLIAGIFTKRILERFIGG